MPSASNHSIFGTSLKLSIGHILLLDWLECVQENTFWFSGIYCHYYSCIKQHRKASVRCPHFIQLPCEHIYIHCVYNVSRFLPTMIRYFSCLTFAEKFIVCDNLASMIIGYTMTSELAIQWHQSWLCNNITVGYENITVGYTMTSQLAIQWHQLAIQWY